MRWWSEPERSKAMDGEEGAVWQELENVGPSVVDWKKGRRDVIVDVLVHVVGYAMYSIVWRKWNVVVDTKIDGVGDVIE